MTEVSIALVAAGVIMGIFDAVWLKIGAKYVYRPLLGKLLLEKPNMVAALLFYTIYIVGVVVFAVMPAVALESWQYALGYGAMLGFVAYATYDLTNLATVKGFSQKVVVIDMVWGTLLTAVVALGSYTAVTLL